MTSNIIKADSLRYHCLLGGLGLPNVIVSNSVQMVRNRIQDEGERNNGLDPIVFIEESFYDRHNTVSLVCVPLGTRPGIVKTNFHFV